jgi:hypothetical protein
MGKRLATSRCPLRTKCHPFSFAKGIGESGGHSWRVTKSGCSLLSTVHSRPGFGLSPTLHVTSRNAWPGPEPREPENSPRPSENPMSGPKMTSDAEANATNDQRCHCQDRGSKKAGSASRNHLGPNASQVAVNQSSTKRYSRNSKINTQPNSPTEADNTRFRGILLTVRFAVCADSPRSSTKGWSLARGADDSPGRRISGNSSNLEGVDRTLQE